MDKHEKYSRLYGSIHDVSLHTKPSTIKISESMTGRSETFIVETCRHADDGDYIFIEHIADGEVERIAIPPKVVRVIASQGASLTRRRRSASSKSAMRARMESGEWTGFKKITHRAPLAMAAPSGNKPS